MFSRPSAGHAGGRRQSRRPPHGPAGACRRRQRFFPRSAERISTIEQDDF
ncbi:hypothetical protein HMPREF3150_02245 [Pseudomonas aeruginosa]|nr:hypothetical protein HMPREF3150_02245 [Pseudomonas aeruginosa]